MRQLSEAAAFRKIGRQFADGAFGGICDKTFDTVRGPLGWEMRRRIKEHQLAVLPNDDDVRGGEYGYVYPLSDENTHAREMACYWLALEAAEDARKAA